MNRFVQITEAEIAAAVAAASAEGIPARPEMIATELARLVESKAREQAEFERLLSGIKTGFRPSGVGPGNPHGIDAETQSLKTQHQKAVLASIQKNKAIIGGAAAAVGALALAAMSGGIATPAVVAGLLGVAQQLSDATMEDLP
jgi:hypothetical protein